MDTRWALILTAPVLLALVAWIAWLLFNLIIARWHGLEGLKATPTVAQAFRPRDWVVLVSRDRERLASAPDSPLDSGKLDCRGRMRGVYSCRDRHHR
ncbi:hypothetical protein [Streptacidiphilus rugosus]|uniref:hypothetical protein n=1 Tax=Streptacidiphilus rugosus TaxID=405783 RepID=UPI0012FAFF67|nr:hypothetical protein [Streptacidiphilus rugosus]